MTAQQLLRLYPRAWRERYGDEFVEMVGPGRLQLQQVVDIVSGAIDAWLSSDVRGATQATAQSTGGVTMVKTVSVCEKNQVRYTRRDGVIGGAIILLGSLLSVVLGTALKRNGYDELAEAVMVNGYLVAMNISLPFWLMKGQSRKSQVVIIGGTTAILLAIAALNL
jgi:hypothetical protein